MENISTTRKRDRLLRLPRVEEATGLRKSTIYGAIKDGLFPRPVKLSRRCVAWRESEIQAWIGQRIAEHERAAR